jgi:hypothetical protein
MCIEYFYTVIFLYHILQNIFQIYIPMKQKWSATFYLFTNKNNLEYMQHTGKGISKHRYLHILYSVTSSGNYTLYVHVCQLT